MKRQKKAYQKVCAVVVLIALLATSIPFTITLLAEKSTLTMENASSEDKRIATEISNETGLSVDKVFNYKTNGRSWNDVMKLIKTNASVDESSQKSDRDKTLLSSGTDDEFIKKLQEEGFTDESINEVKMLVDRVLQQIKDIISDSKIKSIYVTADTSDDKEEISKYEKLSEQINTQNAIYFTLKLKSDFGSYEQALDEYLYSLQLELDLNDYIKDKNAYSDKVAEKKLYINDEQKITVAKIDEKALQILQNELTKENTPDKTVTDINKITDEKNKLVDNNLPELPQADVKDVRPKNPTEQVMNEIKQINPMAK